MREELVVNALETLVEFGQENLKGETRDWPFFVSRSRLFVTRIRGCPFPLPGSGLVEETLTPNDDDPVENPLSGQIETEDKIPRAEDDIRVDSLSALLLLELSRDEIGEVAEDLNWIGEFRASRGDFLKV